jgi:catechol 2,3-dioxygenase
MTSKLTTTTPHGYTHLSVKDLNRSLTFYRDALGLQVLEQDSDSAALGAGQTKLLMLTKIPDAVRPGRSTGLYHVALRLPSRAGLAAFVNHLIESQTPVQGVSDHKVSEAIYLPDPEGNGIEVYHDRPAEDWYDASGDLILTTQPLDLDSVLAELPTENNAWQEMPAGTVVGHIHLHVAELEATRHFYGDLLGMDLVTEYGDSALFFSWDGYHHHVGANIWNGKGAPTPPPNAVGLRYFTLELEQERLDEIRARLKADGIEIEQKHGGLFVHDPAGNGMVLRQKNHASV